MRIRLEPDCLSVGRICCDHELAERAHDEPGRANATDPPASGPVEGRQWVGNGLCLEASGGPLSRWRRTSARAASRQSESCAGCWRRSNCRSLRPTWPRERVELAGLTEAFGGGAIAFVVIALVGCDLAEHRGGAGVAHGLSLVSEAGVHGDVLVLLAFACCGSLTAVLQLSQSRYPDLPLRR